MVAALMNHTAYTLSYPILTCIIARNLLLAWYFEKYMYMYIHVLPQKVHFKRPVCPAAGW